MHAAMRLSSALRILEFPEPRDDAAPIDCGPPPDLFSVSGVLHFLRPRIS